jgi:hypothetical protein
VLFSGFSWDDDVNAKAGKKINKTLLFDNINNPSAGIDTKIKGFKHNAKQKKMQQTAKVQHRIKKKLL